ncbi:MAG: DUF1772 domain-containing protein [Chitinophagaceae bacterium]|nr:MAG: DUF1772 domain-containing protein [Chitinophagaceae bacterium]
MTSAKISLFLALLATGLCAGLFYAYSCSVNPGLAKLDNKAYVTAMQSINVEIQNPAFFASFLGSFLLIPIATWLSYNGRFNLKCSVLLLASLVYIVGAFGVTVASNVPLNEKLALLDASIASDLEIGTAREAFEKSWNAWHSVRTWASVVAFALLGWAAFLSESDN